MLRPHTKEIKLTRTDSGEMLSSHADKDRLSEILRLPTDYDRLSKMLRSHTDYN